MANQPSGTSIRGGVDLGGTKIQAVAVSPGADVLGQARRATPTKGGPEAVARAVAETMQDAATAAGVTTGSLAGVGVGSPGSIDREAGTVTEARNLPDWQGTFALADRLRALLGCPIFLGNDVHVANHAEYLLGSGRGYNSVVGVYWGTGVGGSVILDKREWEGRGAAGELGHMVVVRGGARCTCGRRGCVEAYAGRAAMELTARRRTERGVKTSLFRLMKRRGLTRLTSGVWAQALDEHDRLATTLIDRAVAALGAGIASAVNLLDIDAVVIGGGLGVRLGPAYVARIERAMLPHVFRNDRPPALHLAALGDLGGAIGASLLVGPPPGPRRGRPGPKAGPSTRASRRVASPAGA